jgi:arylsulfatase A-like enzyme
MGGHSCEDQQSCGWWCWAPCLVAADALAAEATNRPNILSSDRRHGYGDLSCYGGKRVETTHIDALASEGIRFTQFYVNAPICSPSRVALTTGQYPGRWGSPRIWTIARPIVGADRRTGSRLRSQSRRFLAKAGYYKPPMLASGTWADNAMWETHR